MSIQLITILMITFVMLGIAAGLPITFVLGGVSIVFLILLGSPAALHLAFFGCWSIINYFVLIAVPLFIFMGIVLQRSGIADDLFEMIYRWIGQIRGGLAMGTVAICAIIAAMSGVSGAATVSMGLIALPSMLKRGYDKIMCVGTIQAGGALGFLIPPSVMMVIYCAIVRVSVGRLFAAGIFPGFMLALFYIIYIGIRCRFQPQMGPPVPPEERFNWRQKTVSLRAIVLPMLLVSAVLGSIIMGICSPTEASAVGAVGVVICALIHRRYSWAMIKDATYTTFRLTGMIMWIIMAAICFSNVYGYFRSSELIQAAVMMMPGGRWGVLIFIQLSFFILGCFLDDTAILIMCMPIYTDIIISMGFDKVWFGILYVLNMQMGFLTPPFGYNLFYMKGIVADLFRTGTISKEISIGDIYRSIGPFVGIQALGLAMVMLLPQIALWLPNLIFGELG